MKGMHGRIFRYREPELVYLNRNQKFQDEKLCQDDGELLIQFDGILIDQKKPADGQERFALLRGLYERFGGHTAAQLKGAFNLLIYDRAQRRVLLTNDRLGKRALYYCALDDELLYAESYYDLLDMLSEEERELQLDGAAICAMIQEGALTGNLCYLRQVRYLDAYESLLVDLERWTVEHVDTRPRPQREELTEDQALERFDRLFTAAVRQQFFKNREYGYPQYATLSGGMDSRACILKGIQCGYPSIFCFTYAQSGSVDQRVSEQIAFDYGLDLLFYPMDAAVFVRRLDWSMDRNECQQSGIGATGAGTMAMLLDTAPMGIIHTGLCGGELMGDLIKPAAKGLRGKRDMFSRRFGLKPRGTLESNTRQYLDNLRICHNSSSMFLPEGEYFSPFLDEDVVAFVSQLDPETLYWRSLYRRWMRKYLPNGYDTTFFYGPITISPFAELLKKTAGYAAHKLTGLSRRDMNPMDHWMSKQPRMQEECRRQFEEGCRFLREKGVSPTLLSKVEERWAADWRTRFDVLTAIRAVRDLDERKLRFTCGED